MSLSPLFRLVLLVLLAALQWPALPHLHLKTFTCAPRARLAGLLCHPSHFKDENARRSRLTTTAAPQTMCDNFRMGLALSTRGAACRVVGNGRLWKKAAARCSRTSLRASRAAARATSAGQSPENPRTTVHETLKLRHAVIA